MNTLLWILVSIIAVALAAVLAHLLFIEWGREVVTLRTQNATGDWNETRLWVVDHDGDPWLHSKGERWEARFAGNPIVTLTRNGFTARYQAEPDRSTHAALDKALRDKYGLADRWVRILAPCDETVMPVRLRRLPETSALR
jgi:hypothetical protein